MTDEFFSRVFRLHPHFAVVPWDEVHTFVVSDDGQVLLTGRPYALVAQAVDGARTVRQLVSDLGNELSPPEVAHTLKLLLQKGFVGLVADPDAANQQLWSALAGDTPDVRARLAAATVAVEGSSAAAEQFASAVEATGLRVDDTADIRVLFADDYLSPAVQQLHRRAPAQGLRWMVIKSSGLSTWTGPMFGGEGACWECLAHRLRWNRPVDTYLARAGRALPARSAVRLNLLSQASLSWAALSLLRWIGQGRSGLLDSCLLTFDARSLHVEQHSTVRRPQCSVCGDAGLYASRVEAPLRLNSVSRRNSDDGGYRIQAPEDTYGRLALHVSPVTGLVASIEPMRERNGPLHPVFVGTYRVCPVTNPPSAKDFHRYSAGKGRSPAQARASALCEALERCAAVYQGDEPTRRARMSELGPGAVHPDLLQNFSDAQRTRAGAASQTNPRTFVPPKFEEHTELDWTPAWSLTHDERRWVPTSYCYSHMFAAPDARWCVFNPNGHAAGNCIEEAILQGLLELVERDAVAIWWYNRLPRPAVNLESFEQPYFTALREWYRSVGWEAWVLDLTNDLGIPCFAALAQPVAGGPYAIGFGCHLDARLAVQRAMTELNQLFEPNSQSSPWGDGDLGSEQYLHPSSSRSSVPQDFPVLCHSSDLREDVRTCIRRMAAAGLETLALDMSRPDVDLSVAKVMVPGLRHIWPRFGTGRLYDVPVELGWLPRPTQEPDLNSVPLLL